MADDRQYNSPSAPACSRRKRGQEGQALGRSRGGFGTKIHALSDALGNPMRFILTGGEKSDFLQACSLLENQKADAILADKGYDADYIVSEIVAMGAEVVIPSRSSRSTQREYDAALYKERNIIERMFSKMKQFRGIATRYSKTAVSFLAFVQLAAILLWLK